ncbi:MAG TPA: hypothetical protein VLL75_20890, partial [Vicinamibacteria bacterium]|nr:hypothetical protein [Vicinamibacteria bacterium]
IPSEAGSTPARTHDESRAAEDAKKKRPAGGASIPLEGGSTPARTRDEPSAPLDAKKGLRFRLDPFAADYDAAIQLNETDEPTAPVDVTVERAEWQPVSPEGREVVPVFFVDGVRRVEHRLLVESDEGTLFGLLGSFGVGATHVDRRRARVSHETIGRLCVVGGGSLVPAVTAPVAGGPSSLTFAPRPVPENTPVAPLEGLQTAMREGEARLAEQLAKRADMVVLDGPLTFLGATTAPVVGLVKRLVRPYLAAPEAGILRRLGVCQRTPIFLIQDRRAPRFSWYARLAHGRSIQSALTGIIRLEASGALALEHVRALADAAARILPPLSSDAAHDPRAPSNLVPVGGLEQRLRRLLGDPALIRRTIEAWLLREATS